MMDDLHELQSPACHDVIGLVLARVPRGSQVVAASRSEQPHLARLRVSGDAMEFVTGDLALDAAAAHQVFSAERVVISPEQAADLAERTEGWPAGLYLAAAWRRTRRRDSGRRRRRSLFRTTCTARRWAANRRTFSASLAAQRCSNSSAALCATPSCSPRARLRTCAGSRPPTCSWSRSTASEWYRYHALYREFLLGNFADEGRVVEKLHLRAADWYESNGSPELAVEQLLHTSDRARAVDLFTRVGRKNHETGRQRTVMRWRSALGDATIEQFPGLAIGAAWARAHGGHKNGTAVGVIRGRRAL